MPRLFLTGGSGMVGCNIRAHHHALNWDLLAPSSEELDLKDATAVRNYFILHKPDLVVHAAGQVGGIQANIAHPVDFLDTNNVIGRNIIMGAWSAGVRQLINLASTCMYPAEAPCPLNEDMILTGSLEPSNEGYAIAKLATARLCEYVTKEDNSFSYKTLIPCNLYGKFDKFKVDYSHLVAAVIHKIHLFLL